MLIVKYYFMPEDEDEFNIEQRAGKFHCVLYSFYESYLHRMVKHGVDETGKALTSKEMKLLEKVEEEFFRCLEQYGLSRDDLYQ